MEEAPVFIEKNLSHFSFEPQTSSSGLDLFSSGGDDLGRLVDVHVIRSFDGVELSPVRIGIEWCELSAEYMSGDIRVPLGDIIETRNRGCRFVATAGSVVDLKRIPLSRLGGVVGTEGKKERVKLSRAALLQLRARGCWGIKEFALNDGVKTCT